MDDEVGHDHIGQSFGKALPFAARRDPPVDSNIRPDVMQTGSGHIGSDAFTGASGSPSDRLAVSPSVLSRTLTSL